MLVGACLVVLAGSGCGRKEAVEQGQGMPANVAEEFNRRMQGGLAPGQTNPSGNPQGTPGMPR
jgi:hypothetical protein